jgi:hypothetical protein
LPKLTFYRKNYQVFQCLYPAGIVRLDVQVLILCQLEVLFPASENSPALQNQKKRRMSPLMRWNFHPFPKRYTHQPKMLLLK